MTPKPEEPGEVEGSSVPDPEMLTDGREIMLAVAAGTPGAFERLVAVYEPRVKAAVARSIRDRSSVEDLAQEVFLRLYRARERYRPTAKFETYLYRIIFNICVNHTQYTARRRALSLDVAADDESRAALAPADESVPRPLEALEADERAAQVRRAIETLPDSQRRALVLSRYEGLAYEEIAEVMSLSLQAVKSLLWRARDNVRQRLAPILGDGAADEGKHDG
jgi:RNA polymerase sigma-70 factor (ECF subfamily)